MPAPAGHEYRARVRARKTYWCEACGELIEPRNWYRRIAIRPDIGGDLVPIGEQGYWYIERYYRRCDPGWPDPETASLPPQDKGER